MATEHRWLIETSIMVDLLRGVKTARVWIDSIPESARTISVVTAAELLAGCRNRSEQRTVESEIGMYETVWLTESISQAALEFYKRFHLSHNVGFLDCLIAATATQIGLRVATLNQKHFLSFPGLDIERPY